MQGVQASSQMAAAPFVVCPAGTRRLDGRLAKLQDRGIGGMVPLATLRTSAGLTVLRPTRPVTCLSMMCKKYMVYQCAEGKCRPSSTQLCPMTGDVSRSFDVG